MKQETSYKRRDTYLPFAVHEAYGFVVVLKWVPVRAKNLGFLVYE